MPIDPSIAIGADLGDREFSWDSSDVLLYHLGIGAGSAAGDNLSPTALSYTVEGPALQVLPSFGIVAPTFHETDPPPLDLPGCDINLSQVVHGSQAITVTEALRTYTTLGAWTGFEEDIKGDLAVGKVADFAILESDPWAIAPEALREMTVRETIAGGRSVYRR